MALSALSITSPNLKPSAVPAAIAGTATAPAACPHGCDHVSLSRATPTDNSATFNFNPQDRMTMTNSTLTIPQVSEGKFGPESDSIALRDKLDLVDGAYVYPDGDPRQNSSLAFATANATLAAFREVFPEKIKWAFSYDKLMIRPNCGPDLNANYKRDSGTLNFYEETDPVRKTGVHSGAIADVVAHETGHAILDAIRPEYFSNWGPEPSAFHESFGDMMAIHMALRDPRVLAKVVAETGGDLGKPNTAAHLAEELGAGVNHKEGKNVTGGDFLRDANNTFKYQDPSKLPSEKGGATELGWSKHSFSRVWTGAHFDVLKAMVKEDMAAGKDAATAISESNAELLKMLATMLLEAPRGKFTYRDMAIAFIQSDKLHNGGKRADLIQSCFTNRGILPADLPAELLEPSVTPVTRSSLFQTDAAPAYRATEVKLGDSMGQFAGAVVEVPTAGDTGIFQSDALQSETERDLSRLIGAGKIRWSEPGQSPANLPEHNARGEHYEGAVSWTDGQMRIEKLHVSC